MIKYLDKDLFLSYVTSKMKQTDIVLDIGSGINPQKFIKPIIHICAEPYEEYANYLLEKKGNTDRFFLVLKQKWNEIVNTIPKNGVDTVITLDVIEHLEKEEGIELLSKTIELARKQVIIFTPYGFMPQEVPEGMKDAWGLDGLEWQRHKSGWTENDFNKNWDIYICKEYHYYDAITKEKFKKPYGAMFAILNKDSKKNLNIFSFINKIRNLFSRKIPLLLISNRYLNKLLIKLYRKLFIK